MHTYFEIIAIPNVDMTGGPHTIKSVSKKWQVSFFHVMAVIGYNLYASWKVKGVSIA